MFPVAVPDPSGQTGDGHPPPAALYRDSPRGNACHSRRPASWISIERASGFPTARWRWQNCEPSRLCQFTSHHRLASPVAPWERLKIGGGTPPVLTRHGWLVVYHGVCELTEPTSGKPMLRYSAGVLMLSEEHPRFIRHRSPEPVLTPKSAAGMTRGLSPTWCFPPASTAATISARRTASTCIMGWPTTGSAWRGLTCRISCRQGHSPTRPERRSNVSPAVILEELNRN